MPFDDEEPYETDADLPTTAEAAYFWATVATVLIGVAMFAAIGFWQVVHDLYESLRRFFA